MPRKYKTKQRYKFTTTLMKDEKEKLLIMARKRKQNANDVLEQLINQEWDKENKGEQQ